MWLSRNQRNNINKINLIDKLNKQKNLIVDDIVLDLFKK